MALQNITQASIPANVADISNHNNTNTTFVNEENVFDLSILDSVIVIVYLLISIGLGLYFSRKHSTASDYFLASRSTSWPFIGLSLFASNISSSTFVGLAGDAYSTGIAVYSYEWFASIILVIYATFYIPKLLDAELYTLPEFLDRRFSRTTRLYFSVLTIVLNITGSAGGLYAGALVIQLIFPQLELWHTITILGFIAGIYTISGGLTAVMYTDALQATVLIIGSIIISIIALIEAGGWNNVKQQVPADRLSIIRPIDDTTLPWTGLFTGLPILGFYYWCTNQTIAQRVLSSKNIDHARWGCILAAFLKVPMLFTMVLPGTMAIVIFPNLPKGDLVFPYLLMKLMPTGLLGLVLSGFIAALMSGIDSALNSTSTLVTMDFVKQYKPNLSEKKLMNIGRIVTFLFMLAAVCVAPMVQKFRSLFTFFQTMLSYLVPPVVVLYIGGFFWKGANARGALLSLILGNVWGIALFIIVEYKKWIYLHFLHSAIILFILTFLLLIGISLTSGKPSTEEQLKITWSSEQLKKDMSLTTMPLYKNYLSYTIVLILLICIIVGIFW